MILAKNKKLNSKFIEVKEDCDLTEQHLPVDLVSKVKHYRESKTVKLNLHRLQVSTKFTHSFG